MNEAKHTSLQIIVKKAVEAGMVTKDDLFQNLSESIIQDYKMNSEKLRSGM